MSFFRPIKSADRFAQDSGEIVLEKFDYDVDGNLIYQGVVNNTAADEADEIWSVVKYTYGDIGGSIRLIRSEWRHRVAWNERAVLGWL